MKKISYYLLVWVFLVAGIHSTSMARDVISGSNNINEVYDLYAKNPDEFKKDMKKYYPSKKKIAGKSVRVLLPIGIGVAMISLSGPQAAIPITIGALSGVAEFIRYMKIKSVRHLFQGAYLHLDQQSGHLLTKSEKRKVKKFGRFYDKAEENFRQQWYPELGPNQVKDMLAIHLLRINHYSWWFAHRFNSDKSVRNQARPTHKLKRVFVSNKTSDKGTFSKGFLKRNLNVLVGLDIQEFSKYLSKDQRQVMNGGVLALQ